MVERQHELHGRRQGRNVGVVSILAGVAVLLFAVTIIKLGENVGNPTSGASWGESLQKWMSE
ncbi:MAG: hypothetical protein AAGK00_07180 [Pseudomonadota bacterium]